MYDTTDVAAGVTTGIKYCVKKCAEHTDANNNKKQNFYIKTSDSTRHCTKACDIPGESTLNLIENGQCVASCTSGLHEESTKVCMDSCIGV